MNKTFYIFRHGETDWNRESRCQGHTDIFLNETGKLQAQELARKLETIDMEIIVSSDLKRALSTGDIVAQKKGIPLIIEPRFREMSYGVAEGMLYDEAIKSFGAEIWQHFQDFNRRYDHVGFPGGETRLLVRTRFLAGLMDLVKNSSHKSIGISTHGGALRNVLHGFLPEDHHMLPIPNCVVYKCEYLAKTQDFIVDPCPL